MRLSRDKIQRMIDAGGGSSSGGGGGSDIAGGVTQAWVNQNYVSIEFFRKVFKVWAAGETSSDPDVEIMPNDLATTVKNIQAQAGLWTEAFLSALGRGSGGGTGGATTLDQLDDVTINTPTDGQALIYDATTQMWVNGTIQSGTDMATVWSALAAATNEQINASHLSGVLADYVTTTSLQTILGDYLTQTAADQRYITIAYFDRLFRAYNGNTLVTHNDTTTTIDNIKAMFGFWTDMYLSALGRNSVATGLGIDNLTDVTINTPTDGQVLQYNANSSKWENANAQAGVTDLANLTDVTLTSLQGNQILVYDALAQKWFNSSVKTINGYSIFGTGNIDASGGGTGAYLPLAGGTMTGRIIFNYNRTSYDLTYQNNGSQRGGMGYWAALDILYINHDIARRQLRLSPNANVSIVDLSASGEPDILTLTAAGNLVLHAQAGNILLGQLSHGPTTFTDGTPFACWVGNDSHNGFAYYTFSDLRTYLNDYYPHSSGFYTLDAGNITWGVLSTSNGYTTLMHWLTPIVSGDQGGYGFAYKGGQAYMQVDGFFYQNEGNYRVYDVSGGTINGSVYATGAVTALSDIRKKDIQDYDTGLTVEQVAMAPTIKFLWKNKKEEGMQVGSIAQFWQKALPEVVRTEDDNCLSLQYGVAALVSAIITARKVVDHERRISELEKENERLRTEVEQLRLN